MSWLAPLFGLAALASLPLIVVLHLLRQRQRRVRVPSLDLWHDPSPTVQRNPRRLPLTLPLLLRLLVALLLALALGRPLVRGLTNGPTTTVMLLDTSTSMLAMDVVPSRWSQAQAEARHMVSNLHQGDELVVIALANPPRLVARGGADARAALERSLVALTPGGTDGSLQTALDLGRVALDRQTNARVVVLTDTARHAPSTINALAPVDWRAFGSTSNNVAFAAFAARTTRTGTQLYARVSNLGTAPTARTLTLALDGKTAATETVRLEPGADAEWSWPLPPNTQRAEATLDAGDPLAQDDRQAVVLQGNAALRVLVVSPTPSPLERALRALPNVVVSTAQPQSYTTAAADLVVFSGFVPLQLPPVPVWLVAPPSSSVLPITGTRNDVAVDSVIDQRFGALDLRPVRFDGVAVVRPPEWASVALGGSKDTPLVLTGVYNGRPLTAWLWDPDKRGFGNRVQFPLLAAATLRTLVPSATRQYAPGDPAPQALVAPDGQQVVAGTALGQVGIYTASNQQAALAVNLVDPVESNLTMQQRPQITIEDNVTQRDQASVGRELWRLAVLLVCAGLGGEALWALWQRRDLRPKAVRA